MVNYESWEYIYFQEILDLHEIFCIHMKQLTSKNFHTLEFLRQFGKFIKSLSRDNISEFKYIEPLNASSLEVYDQLIISQNE